MLRIDYERVEGTHAAIVKDVMKYGVNVLPETVHHNSTLQDPEKFTTKEIVGYSFCIHSLHDLDLVLDSPFSTCNKEWARQEFLDRVENFPNPGRAVELDAKWQKMLEADGKYAYTYGERWANQLPAMVAELKAHPNTRQAILTTWDSNIDQDRLGKRRIPCTIHSQFLLRNGTLNQIYHIRSNDAIWIMSSDIYQMGMIQKYVAQQIGAPCGSLLYHTGSLHVYKRDADLILNKLGVAWD